MQTQNEKTLLYQVRSETEENKNYTVRFFRGEWLCSCPAFTLQRKSLGECKHIKKVLGWEKVEND